MNLVIDQGNSKTKIAIFDNNDQKEIFEADFIEKEIITSILQKYEIENCIFGTVKNVEDTILNFLKDKFKHFILLNSSTPLPVKLGYKTPSTLGMDRVAAVVGANAETPDCPVIVIDAGTAITYDFITKDGVFEGGNIAPGMKMRLKSLNEYTDKLPLVDAKGETPIVGYNTETAIRSGVVNGICYEIEGFISQIKAIHPSVLVFLTGGDAFFLSEKLKCLFFVDKNLVLKGLNRILNYNVER
ncbi:MAG: type III pantothenate kinase [Bacteroidales bacterium]|nr:type III pantothenate kinase [Bacteroidales bacterium]